MSLNYNEDLIQCAKKLRKNQTPQENKLWHEFLVRYPIRFQRQKVIDNFIADLYCAKARLVIELDGGGHYTQEKIKYDEKRTAIFKKIGIKVLRFTNTEVERNFRGVCETIDREVRSRDSLPQARKRPT